jgi:hypothetical protein
MRTCVRGSILMSATYDQLASVPLAHDLVVHNYGTTDIDAGQAVTIETTNYVGDGTNTIPGVSLPTQSDVTPQAIGITVETIKAGTNGRVRCLGVATATSQASGTISPMSVVAAAGPTSNSGGITGGATGYPYLGYALSGGASGDPISVFVLPGPWYNA